MGGLVAWDDAVSVPNGLALDVQNMVFLSETVKTRWGLRYAMQLLTEFGNVTGMDVLTVLGNAVTPSAQGTNQQAGGASRGQVGGDVRRRRWFPPSNGIAANTQVGIVFTDAGQLCLELPAGSGTLIPVPIVPAANPRIAASIATLLPAGAVMQTAKAYNRIYMAFTDLLASKAPVLALDAATGWISPVEQNPIAAIWQADTFYQEGDIVTPSTTAAIWYRRVVTGYSGATEPTWPTPNGGAQGLMVLGYFTPTYQPYYITADDNGVTGVWQEWTPGFPNVLPSPIPAGLIQQTGGGTIAANLDVYMCFCYFNDLGESIWTQPFAYTNTSAAATLTYTFNRPSAASGPPMPTWLMSVMNLGTTTDGLHWPSSQCINIYVASVAHNAAAPTQYRLYGTASADGPLVVTSIPGSGTLFTPRTIPTAAISTEQFMGEGGVRNAVLLRQNTMGDLSPVDPQGVLPVQFAGASYRPAGISVGAFVADVAQSIPLTVNIATVKLTNPSSPTIPGGTYYAQIAKVVSGVEVAWTQVLGPFNVTYYYYSNTYLVTMELQLPGDSLEDSWTLYYGSSPTNLTSKITGIGKTLTSYDVITAGVPASPPLPQYMYLAVNDVTEYSPGMLINVQSQLNQEWSGDYSIFAIYPSMSVGWDGNFIEAAVSFPQGTLVIYSAAGFTPSATPSSAIVSFAAGPCPVAVIPPGVQEGPGYSYDVLAFTVAGLGVDGPFNYLTDSTPANPFSTSILVESTDGNGNAFMTVGSTIGLAAGDTVLIAGWTAPHTKMNGQRVLATIGTSNNVVTLPDTMPVGVYPAPILGVTMTVVQTEPTQVAPGKVGILLQFDDSTLPQGVDVTGNLLFVALPQCIDLAYLPSVQRMAYVTDAEPSTAVFSENSFMGEVDGLNDVQAIEPSNGSRLVGVRELLNGDIIAFKENGGYQILPTADAPARWGQSRRWGIHGPQSGRNIATGRDGTTGLDFAMFVDPESGLYKWPPTLGQGELDWLSKELSGANNQDASRMAIWDRVNRAAGAQIQVVVDDIAKEVKIAVPLDGATTPSHILTMSYFNGWQDPLMLTLSGEWVANRTSRRWNIDPIPTRSMAMVKRTLATPVDQRCNYHQLLIGQYPSTANSVSVLYMQPGAYDDLGAGYESRYWPSYAKEPPSQQFPAGGRYLRFSACTGHMLGSGDVEITPRTYDPTYEEDPEIVNLDEGQAQVPGSAPVTYFAVGIMGDNELLSCEFSNGGVPGAWFQLVEEFLWFKPLEYSK
jgi:hypothetical protein